MNRVRLGSGFRVKDRVRVAMVFKVRVRFSLSVQWMGVSRNCFRIISTTSLTYVYQCIYLCGWI